MGALNTRRVYKFRDFLSSRATEGATDIPPPRKTPRVKSMLADATTGVPCFLPREKLTHKIIPPCGIYGCGEATRGVHKGDTLLEILCSCFACAAVLVI